MIIIATIVALAIIWVFLFALFIVPARMIGTWVFKKMPPMTGGAGVVQNVAAVALSIKATFLLVSIGGLALLIAFKHPDLTSAPEFDSAYKSDHIGFSRYMAGLLLFVPTFATLVVGYFRARKMAFATLGRMGGGTGGGMGGGTGTSLQARLDRVQRLSRN